MNNAQFAHIKKYTDKKVEIHLHKASIPQK